MDFYGETSLQCRAAGQGIEPRLTVPETAVLPLDDPAKDLDWLEETV